MAGPTVRPTVAVLGVGVVGGRLARELVSANPGLGVALHASDPRRRDTLREVFESAAIVRSHDDEVDSSVEVVVLAGDPADQVEAARLHLGAGRHVVATADRAEIVEQLLGLDGHASHHDRNLAVGSAFSPGLSCLLARFAADRLDRVDEVRFARHGAAGPRCAVSRLTALRQPAPVWRDGRWEEVPPGSGRELCWFPDPVAGADAYLAATGEPALAVDAFGGLRRSSARLVLSRWDRVAMHLPTPWPAPAEGGVGAIRVEVRGAIGRERRTIVMGALDRPGVAAAAVGAEVVLGLLGGTAPAGAHGLAAWTGVPDMLSRLRRRGIRVAELDSDAVWSADRNGSATPG